MNNLLLSFPTIVQLAGEETPTLLGNLVIPFAIAIVLVLLNGVFVAAEFAILGARASKMEKLSEEGDAKATKILGILESTDKLNGYLATAQLGITIVTLVLAAYAEPLIAQWLEYNVIGPVMGRDWHDPLVVAAGYIITLGFLTYLHVVLGEMVPKSMALSNPNSTAKSLNWFMSAVQSVLAIPVKILNMIGDGLLRLLRIPPEHGHARLYSSEEIEQLVVESKEGGLITEEAEEIITNIFDFHDRAVDQVMTPRRKIEGVSHDTPYDALLNIAVSSRHSRFPVYEGDLDHVVGVLHLKDLLKHYRNGGAKNFEMAKLLRKAPIVPEDHSVTDLLGEFKRDRLHMAVVLDEYGGVSGLVTLEDLVEEIVGEVRDEFDTEREPKVEVEPGVVEIAGRYLLDDLKEFIFLGEDETLPDVDTAAGLVVTHLGAPPKIDDKIELETGVKFQVLSVEGRAVTRLRVTYPVPEAHVKGTDSAETEH